MTPDEIKPAGLFPYPSLPHPKHANGGQVFPQMQIDDVPAARAVRRRLRPARRVPARVPAGDLPPEPAGAGRRLARRGRLDQQLLPPVQGHPDAGAARRPAPAADAASRRRSSIRPTTARRAEPSLGVACFDCHVNGHTTGQFHLNPDIRPQERRFRLDTTSLRGVFNQQIHGSKRSLRSVEDFTEFEQRTAYFNGDPIHADEEGVHEHPRPRPGQRTWRRCRTCSTSRRRPKLDPTRAGSIRTKATESELRGEKLFFGKGQCASCHPAAVLPRPPDARPAPGAVPQDEPGDGPIKTFTLRGIKDSPPYLHDGRCLTLEDTVEFFNLVLGLKLTAEEKKDLVAFLRTL